MSVNRTNPKAGEFLRQRLKWEVVKGRSGGFFGGNRHEAKAAFYTSPSRGHRQPETGLAMEILLETSAALRFTPPIPMVENVLKAWFGRGWRLGDLP